MRQLHCRSVRQEPDGFRGIDIRDCIRRNSLQVQFASTTAGHNSVSEQTADRRRTSFQQRRFSANRIGRAPKQVRCSGVASVAVTLSQLSRHFLCH